MSMSSGGGDSGGPMAEINVTPLVDVMLVLLIIFMITAPLMSHKVVIVLPDAKIEIKEEAIERPITISIKESGAIFWNDEPILKEMMDAQLAIEAQKEPQPGLEIRADKTTRYQIVAEVMTTARKNGIKKVGFVTTPAQ